MPATASRFDLPTTPAADFVSGVVHLYEIRAPVSAGFVRALAVTVAELADEITPATVAAVEIPGSAADSVSAARVRIMADAFRNRAAAWRVMRPDAVADAVAEILGRLSQD